VEKKKAEPRTPHFLRLNQDIVARSQEQQIWDFIIDDEDIAGKVY